MPQMIANPALDYIGTGGGAFMVIEPTVSCWNACAGNYSMQQVKLDTEAGMRQTWRLYSVELDDPAAGVSAQLPPANWQPTPDSLAPRPGTMLPVATAPASPNAAAL